MNQVAVVIGGGQTLGAFLCHGLAAEGYRVAVVDIQSDKAANVAQEINAEYGEGTAYGFGADATSEQSVLALSRGVDEIFGRVDLLVYSAGIAKAAFISDFQLGDFDRSLQVNLVGYFLCAREFSRLMIRDGIQGRIIQINSKSGKVGSKHNSGYSAAKFGGVGLTQSLALDLAEYGITVHSLMLGNLLKSPRASVAIATICDQAGYQTGSSRAVLHRQSTAQTRLRLSGCAEYAAVLRQS